MNSILAKVIDDNKPKISKKIVEGTAKEVLKYAPMYLNNITEHSIRSVPEFVDFKYVGYRHVQPNEEYKITYANKENKTPFDLATSDIYLIELMFTYQGQPINRMVYLPFAKAGNLMKMSGVEYHIVPVLSDTVLSPSHKDVFMRIHENKVYFRNVGKNFIVNGVKQHGHLIHSDIFRVNKKYVDDNLGKQFSATALYLLARYGLKQALQKFTGIMEVIVTTDDETANKYRNDKYVVYESIKIKPKGLKGEGYVGHNVKIIISANNSHYNQYTENLIFGLIYTLDILPEHAEEFVTIFNDNNAEDETFYWKVMLGRVAYMNAYSVHRIIKDIEEHFMSLEGYMDSETKQKLSNAGMVINDFFDLLALILENYNIWLINSKEYNSDINNRYIDILYYLFHDTIVGFNRVTLAINKRLSKKTPSFKEVQKLLQDHVRSKKVFSLTKSREVNLAVNMAESTSDIKYPKMTAMLEDLWSLVIVILK